MIKSRLQPVWEQNKVWIIMIAIQFVANLIGQLLPDGIQIVLMFSSGLMLLVLSGVSVYYQRNNILGFVLNIMLLYFNYSMVATVYWNHDGLDVHFTGYTWEEFLRCINIELVFYGTYLCVLKRDLPIDRNVFTKQYKHSNWVVAACTAYILLAPFLFYKTEQFGTRGIFSAFYEYSLVVLIVALRFSGRKIKPLVALCVASAWLVIHGLLHGERVLSLQILIVWGLYLLLHFLSLKIVIPGCIAGIFVFTLFGMYRGMNALEGDVFSNVLTTLFRGGLANDTSYAAYQAGMSIVRFADLQTIWDKLTYLFKYILYLIGGSSVPDVNLSVLSAQFNYHCGGGWLPYYFYFWLGYVGVILCGAALAMAVNITTELKEKKFFTNYLALYIVATCPRWYLYSPASLTRGILVYAVLYYLLKLTRRWMPVAWDWGTQKLEEYRKDAKK